MVEKVGPSVVQIDVTSRDPNAGGLFRSSETTFQRGTGSGVLFTPDGAILTNNHVIEQALAMNVRLADGRLLPARLVGRDPATDLAVLRIDAKGLPSATFADSDTVRVGEWVMAIGSPFGLGRTVTTGVVSAKGRNGLGANAIEDYLQTDASINPGNSGGPLVTLDGQVLGVATMIIGRGSGIGFAVPSNMARRVGEQLLAKGSVERAWIGVSVQDVTPDLARELNVPAGVGALINAVNPEGPGAHANLKNGDVVLSVNGKALVRAQDLIRDVLQYEPGRTVVFEVIRSGRRYATNIVLVARKEPAPPPIPAQLEVPSGKSFGLSLRDVPGSTAASALCQVVGVEVGSLADRAGVLTGDAIVEADRKADPNAAVVQQAAMDGRLLLRLRRRDAFLYVALTKKP